MESMDPRRGKGEVCRDAMALVLGSGRPEATSGPVAVEVAQVWGSTLLDVRHLEEGRITVGAGVGWRWRILGVDLGRVRPSLRHVLAFAPPLWSEVSSEWRSDLYAPIDEEHVLVEAGTVRVGSGWPVVVHDGDDEVDATVFAGRIPLVDGRVVAVEVDGTAFVVRQVPRPVALAARRERADGTFLGMLAGSAFLGALLGLAMAMAPPPSSTEAIEVPDQVRVMLARTPPPPPPEPKEVKEVVKKEPAPRTAGEPGKAGKRDGWMKEAMARRGGADLAVVNEAGLMSAIDGVLGGPGLADGLEQSVGGLTGPKGVQIGDAGFARRGDGLGGGGAVDGLAGFSGGCAGTDCTGRDAWKQAGIGKTEGRIGTGPSGPMVLGSIDRAQVDEVVKAHLNAIRYCYQRELTRNPGLAGKVVVNFAIAKDGSVSRSQVKSSTLGSARVDDCVAGRFYRMEFPALKGGELAVVTYPFLFSPG